jgi:hypothetical protein
MKNGILSMVVFAYCVLLGVLTSSTYAEDTPKPNCSYNYGMCAYADGAGREITEPVYEHAEQFQEGLAAVGIKGKFGYITESGELAIPLKFDSAGPFTYGLAVIELDGKAGVIDRQGTQILPPIYGSAIPISQDAVIVSTEQRDSVYGIMSVKGGWQRKPDLTSASAFSGNGGGLIWAEMEAGFFGLMNARGSWIIEPRFQLVGQLQEGRAVVAQDAGGIRKWGFVGENGQIVIEPNYDWLSYVANGYALYRANGKEGLVDRNGKIIIEAKFDELERPGRNGFLRAKLDGAEVFVDVLGTVFEQFPTAGLPQCPDGRPLIVEQGKYFTLASKKYFTHESAEYACNAPRVEKLSPGRFVFKSPDGKKIFEGDFDDVGISSNGVALVKTGTKWGVVDWSGQYLIPLTESKCKLGYSGHGAIVVSLKHKSITLNRDSAAALGHDMAQLAKCTGSFMICSGACPSKIGEKWGYIDDEGNEVLPPKYDYASEFRHGRAWVAIPEKRQWCTIDSTGAIMEEKPCRCKQPLIAFETERPSFKVNITDCYDAGLYDVVKSNIL